LRTGTSKKRNCGFAIHKEFADLRFEGFQKVFFSPLISSKGFFGFMGKEGGGTNPSLMGGGCGGERGIGNLIMSLY
jgi:hypothetical protein